MQLGRPDPDELLQRVAADERRAGRGRLKIFLGYAAGVGKTYSMLEAARERRGQGVDVVVAYVETHGRADTERLLEGLEVMPRRRVEYRGAQLGELDLDAVLARAPQLALVDEFAHTNATGSRHPKRYQDVDELLDAGIDVYTTLNIQHLESFNDVVAQITGVHVRETVPDLILEEGVEIELVDLPPEELLLRLREGKVYVPDQAERALEQFFRTGNLSALREMSLRRAAQQVDAQMMAYMQTEAIPGPWPAGERILVAVGPSPLGERLVRAAKRLADELKAEWLAVYVETPADADSPERQERAAANLALATRLGARVHTTSGSSVAETLVDYARRHNVTKLIAGKPVIPRWREIFQGSLMDRVIRLSGDIDVYVISSAPHSETRTRTAARRPRRWRPYLYATLPVVLATLVGLPLSRVIEPTNLVMLYLTAVVLSGVYLGRGPAILAAVLSVLAFDFFLVPPYLTMAVSDTQYLLTFAGLFIVGLVVSSLAARESRQAQIARRRELQTTALYELSRDLAGASGVEEITGVVTAHVRRLMGGRVVVLLREGDRLEPAPGSEEIDADGRAVATWVLGHGQQAGRGTDTLPGADLLYLPLRSTHEVLGVLGVEGSAEAAPNSSPETRVLEASASLAALAFERAQLSAAANQLELLKAEEALQSALLNSISHELRTPLASIAGVLSTLRTTPRQDGPSAMTEDVRGELVETAWEEAEHLNRVVGNLLDMTRLQSGSLRPALELVDVEDLVGSALRQLDAKLTGREVRTAIAPDLPPVAVDHVLMVHVLANVLDNAVSYSPPDSPLDVSARLEGTEVRIAVGDRGVGIRPEDLEHVFDKFFRVPRAQGERGLEATRGIGLGLSICRGFVEAHHGTIWAANRAGGGTLVTIALPAAGDAAERALP